MRQAGYKNTLRFAYIPVKRLCLFKEVADFFCYFVTLSRKITELVCFLGMNSSERRGR
jgi:hypothetical protein